MESTHVPVSPFLQASQAPGFMNKMMFNPSPTAAPNAVTQEYSFAEFTAGANASGATAPPLKDMSLLPHSGALPAPPLNGGSQPWGAFDLSDVDVHMGEDFETSPQLRPANAPHLPPGILPKEAMTTNHARVLSDLSAPGGIFDRLDSENDDDFVGVFSGPPPPASDSAAPSMPPPAVTRPVPVTRSDTAPSARSADSSPSSSLVSTPPRSSPLSSPSSAKRRRRSSSTALPGTRDKSSGGVKRSRRRATRSSSFSENTSVKRARTAYILFTMEHRPKVREELPAAHMSAISVKLGEMWRSLPPPQRKIYEQKAQADKQRYKQEKQREAVRSATVPVASPIGEIDIISTVGSPPRLTPPRPRSQLSKARTSLALPSSPVVTPVTSGAMTVQGWGFGGAPAATGDSCMWTSSLVRSHGASMAGFAGHWTLHAVGALTSGSLVISPNLTGKFEFGGASGVVFGMPPKISATSSEFHFHLQIMQIAPGATWGVHCKLDRRSKVGAHTGQCPCGASTSTAAGFLQLCSGLQVSHPHVPQHNSAGAVVQQARGVFESDLSGHGSSVRIIAWRL